jgi:heavy metal sensor kinase
MKWIKTIRVRFALWTTALILALLAAFSIFVYFNLSTSLNAAVDTSLAVSAAQATAGVSIQNGQVIITEPSSTDNSGIHALSERGMTVIVLAPDGRVLQAVGPYRDTAIPIQGTPPSNPQGTYITLIDRVEENDPLRAYILPVMDNGQVAGWVQVIESLGSVKDALARLLTTLLIGGAMLLFFAALGGYMLSARALQPIGHITRTAQRITGGEDLSARLNLPDTSDEVSHLSATFDTMLARLENSFRRERQFTADASHELRTPLAAMQAILSVTCSAERPASAYRQALDDLSLEANRMRGLVEDLLRLARGESGGALECTPLDLSTLLTDVVDSLRPLAQTRRLDMIVETPAALPFTGDMDALIRLFVNLLDNAIKYTEKGTIRVSAQAEESQVMVSICDNGVGIPPEHLSRIFDRFYRVETARSSGGTGLGLAIARQIVQAHGGEISAESKVGKGTRISVLLPTSEK